MVSLAFPLALLTYSHVHVVVTRENIIDKLLCNNHLWHYTFDVGIFAYRSPNRYGLCVSPSRYVCGACRIC